MLASRDMRCFAAEFVAATFLFAAPSNAVGNSPVEWLSRIEQVIERLQEESIEVTNSVYKDTAVKFRLFVPKNTTANDSLPLIVWLHGRGESGDDNALHLRWLDLIFTDLNHPEQYQFYLCALQCPSNYRIWFQARDSKDATKDPITVAYEIVDYLLEQYPIDRKRIYLSGVSSGGAGCWEMAMRKPELFAAMAPLASPGADLGRLSSLRGLPIWAFHATDDPDADVKLVRDTIHQLQGLGGTCILTETDGVQHDCWTAAFEDYDLLDWLLSQSRDCTDCPPPGSVDLMTSARLFYRSHLAIGKWWPQACMVLGIAATLFIVRREWRRRTAGQDANLTAGRE